MGRCHSGGEIHERLINGSQFIDIDVTNLYRMGTRNAYICGSRHQRQLECSYIIIIEKAAVHSAPVKPGWWLIMYG